MLLQDRSVLDWQLPACGWVACGLLALRPPAWPSTHPLPLPPALLPAAADGECFSCPDGTKCTGSSPGSSASPCTADEAPPPCPGLYGDFQCIDARRYCLVRACQRARPCLLPCLLPPACCRCCCYALRCRSHCCHSPATALPQPAEPPAHHLLIAPAPAAPQDGATITCPRSGWCHGNAGESPCKSTPPPEEQSCTVKNNACIDFK